MTKTLQRAIEEVTATQRKAFIPYIMAGDGGLEQTREQILYLQQKGVTAIEIGIPFSDPVADGPIIEAAGIRALQSGTNLREIIHFLRELQEEVHLPLIIMSYLNPIIRYGIAQFVADLADTNVAGLIIPDMPVEEATLISEHTKGTDIALVQLVSLTSSLERITAISEQAEGFVYAVTVNGITGSKAAFATYLQEHLQQLKETVAIPVLAGFGIASKEDAMRIGKNIDGIIVGSAIVEAFHEQNEEKLASFFENNEVTN